SERLIAQILSNLLKNGAQAAGAGGWVRLSCRAENDRLVVETTDSGPGVPVAVRHKIFDLFFTTKRQGEGSGIGLYFSRKIAESHGGCLEVREQQPEGTYFHFEIPLRAVRDSRISALP